MTSRKRSTTRPSYDTATGEPSCHHATKRSPAQLQREIDEALAKPQSSLDFENAKDEGARLDAEVDVANAAVKSFPHLPNGLPVEAVRVSPKYQAARAVLDRAFTRLQRFNTTFVKKFKKEMRAERREKSAKELQEERRMRQARVEAELKREG